MHNKRQSKLFGYRDTIETPKQRIAGGSSDVFQTTHTMPGGQSFARTPQVYHVEETFYSKYGCKGDETEHLGFVKRPKDARKLQLRSRR